MSIPTLIFQNFSSFFFVILPGMTALIFLTLEHKIWISTQKWTKNSKENQIAFWN